MQIVHSIFVGSHLDKQDFNQWCVGHHWGRVVIDITGKHPKSRNGYEYILNITDYFRNHMATTVARVLMDARRNHQRSRS